MKKQSKQALGAGLAATAAVAAYDKLQRKRSILRQYPLLGHARYLAETIRPEIP